MLLFLGILCTVLVVIIMPRFTINKCQEGVVLALGLILTSATVIGPFCVCLSNRPTARTFERTSRVMMAFIPEMRLSEEEKDKALLILTAGDKCRYVYWYKKETKSKDLFWSWPFDNRQPAEEKWTVEVDK